MFVIRYYDYFDTNVNEMNCIWQIRHEINNFIKTIINAYDLILN